MLLKQQEHHASEMTEVRLSAAVRESTRLSASALLFALLHIPDIDEHQNEVRFDDALSQAGIVDGIHLEATKHGV